METSEKATRSTPGPWFATNHHINGQSDAFVLASIPDSTWVVYADRKDVCDEAEADARVMAAAPDMLAALKVADAAINPPDRDGISLHEWNTRLKVATSVIHAAIAKAEGAA